MVYYDGFASLIYRSFAVLINFFRSLVFGGIDYNGQSFTINFMDFVVMLFVFDLVIGLLYLQRRSR